MSLQLRGKRVGVERVSKAAQTSSFLAMPEDTSSVGLVAYVSSDLADSGLSVGQKVYFGNEYTPIRVSGVDILVMDEKNVFGVLEQTT